MSRILMTSAIFLVVFQLVGCGIRKDVLGPYANSLGPYTSLTEEDFRQILTDYFSARANALSTWDTSQLEIVTTISWFTQVNRDVQRSQEANLPRIEEWKIGEIKVVMVSYTVAAINVDYEYRTLRNDGSTWEPWRVNRLRCDLVSYGAESPWLVQSCNDIPSIDD